MHVDSQGRVGRRRASQGESPWQVVAPICHAYWQLALDLLSQEIFSLQTPLGIYIRTRLLKGSTDAGSYFRGATAPLFLSNSDRLLRSLDDFLRHVDSDQGLLTYLRAFFQIWRDYGLMVLLTWQSEVGWESDWLISHPR
jgi:hypothetical protein